MHEDLNRIIRKPKITDKDFEPGGDEEQYYQECMRNLKARNDSFVMDLLYGSYRCQITCPTCTHVSLKFEPFNMLSVPVPVSTNPEQRRNLTMFFISSYSLFDYVKIIYKASKDEYLNHVIASICEHRQVDQSKVNLYYFDAIEGEFTLHKEKYPKVEELPPTTRKNFMFLIEDRNEQVSGNGSADEVQVSIELKGCDKEEILKLKKILKVKHEVEVRKLYKFVYDCILGKCEDMMTPDFDAVFSTGTSSNALPFTLTVHPSTPLEYLSPSETVTLHDNDVIYIDILDKKLKANKRLFTLADQDPEDKIDRESKTVYDCLNLFTHSDVLDEDNKWYCAKCKDHKKAHMEMRIKKLPPVLIIHLKRFKKHARSISKISDAIDFPTDCLDMSRYVSDPSAKAKYRLYGIVNHMGEVGYGHYTAFVRNNDKWFLCDDADIKETYNLPKERAYILFYSLIN